MVALLERESAGEERSGDQGVLAQLEHPSGGRSCLAGEDVVENGKSKAGGHRRRAHRLAKALPPTSQSAHESPHGSARARQRSHNLY